MTAGVLAGWLAEKGGCDGAERLDLRYPVLEMFRTAGTRPREAETPTAPWFTPVYILGTLAGVCCWESYLGRKKQPWKFHGCREGVSYSS